MTIVRSSGPRENVSLVSGGVRPVVLATLDVPFAHEAMVFAVDSAVETGQPLVVVNVAEIHPTHWSLVGYGYIENEDLQRELLRPPERAHSLAVGRARLGVCSPHPGELRRRRYESAAKRIRKRAPCLVWIPAD